MRSRDGLTPAGEDRVEGVQEPEPSTTNIHTYGAARCFCQLVDQRPLVNPVDTEDCQMT